MSIIVELNYRKLKLFDCDLEAIFNPDTNFFPKLKFRKYSLEGTIEPILTIQLAMC